MQNLNSTPAAVTESPCCFWTFYAEMELKKDKKKKKKCCKSYKEDKGRCKKCPANS